jgi:hypothetical protein
VKDWAKLLRMRGCKLRGIGPIVDIPLLHS